MTRIPYLRVGEPFPPATQASREGIVCYGGDLSPTRLLDAYRAGIFPWFNENDPILWWSPNPRCLLFPDDLIIRKSFEKRLRNGGFEVRFDTDFASVIRACRSVDGRDEAGTWITQSIIEAYETLHHMGYAHSVETYIDDELVGGLYGVSLGGGFFGESMFSRVNDGSKVALVGLVAFAKHHGLEFIDAQIPTQHILSMGAVTLPREDFLTLLAQTLQRPTLMGNWGEKR
ncbi:MAG: hypothetical protein KU37_07755 [Sulfuricurvum sp. PC08-66]|nr:MAG: hypothetical protein KU37_07755 [Sulfuricurvum sp. PC08-66]